MTSTNTPELLCTRYRAVLDRLNLAKREAHREEDSVRLIAVGKTYPVEDEYALYQSGVRAFGENYVQEATLKRAWFLEHVPLEDQPEWHLIGQLQSNKTKEAAQFDWVHAVDREKIAKRLSEQRLRPTPLNILIEVNADEEPGKGGVSFEGLIPLVSSIQTLPNLVIRGLMAIPNPQLEPEVRRQSLARVHEAFETLKRTFPNLPLDTLSMGMSHDLEWAVEAGSTMIRVGQAIFGPRHYSNR